MPARAGFHLSTCAMLPWIRPTLIGVPLGQLVRAQAHAAPDRHRDESAPSVDAAAIVRRRPFEIAASAKPVLSSATNNDRP